MNTSVLMLRKRDLRVLSANVYPLTQKHLSIAADADVQMETSAIKGHASALLMGELADAAVMAQSARMNLVMLLFRLRKVVLLWNRPVRFTTKNELA
jgi:sugar phosphate permease